MASRIPERYTGVLSGREKGGGGLFWQEPRWDGPVKLDNLCARLSCLMHFFNGSYETVLQDMVLVGNDMKVRKRIVYRDA